MQAARLSYVCPATSLWGGRANPPLGVRFHVIREHLPWAAAQKGQGRMQWIVSNSGNGYMTRVSNCS